jgi:hypothetical protein
MMIRCGRGGLFFSMDDRDDKYLNSQDRWLITGAAQAGAPALVLADSKSCRRASQSGFALIYFGSING